MTDSSTRQVTRRSQRVAPRIPIRIEYVMENLSREALDVFTIVVSPHGALIKLPRRVPQGHRLKLHNVAANRTQDAIAVFGKATSDGEFEIGVDLPSPIADSGVCRFRLSIGR